MISWKRVSPARNRLLATLAFMTVLLVGAGRATADATPEQQAKLEQEAREGGYGLIEADELVSRMKADPEGVVLVDTRQGWEHRTGHIPGSLHFSMEPTWWARWRARGKIDELLKPHSDALIAFY
ncbi:MAG: hypothetical protein CME06_01540 [Gemmatimonadetes bacterium]|nr:hypothetical protein [Gemmatimonadota bacterium]